MTLAVGAYGLHTQTPADLVDRDHGVCALVGIDADYRHAVGTPPARLGYGTPGAHGGGHASIEHDGRLLSSHAPARPGSPAKPHIGDKPSTYPGSEETSEPRQAPLRMALTRRKPTPTSRSHSRGAARRSPASTA